ncbi:MAG: DUF1343 domain-containing protein [Bacteriovoracaceae bacterium]|jgi:uncharacterized protein YbbC (DUF1343 family)|nr:DUF1343 domain-containing protein [Bacteriovoracaceae bacterium]
MVKTGLDILCNDKSLQKEFSGNCALLCHSASVDNELNHALIRLKDIFSNRLIKVFGPQHGFVTDVQDNMIETDHYTHPYFKIPIYSLYSETRKPTQQMLENIDHLFIDLQDVGTRIYTYIYTMTYVLEACARKNIEVIILDRPNPVGCMQIEGNILDLKFASFVGRHELPVRHSLTMAEVALMHQKYWAIEKCNLRIISMQNYKRSMYFEDTKLPWVMPSPNLPTVDGCFTFVGTVLFEGTCISEGRGTTRPLEIVGHPLIKPFELKEHLDPILKKEGLEGFTLRALNYLPTFQKHAGNSCGGFQIHVKDREKFKAWKLNQILCKEFVNLLGANFHYKDDPYEYGGDLNPMDMINGDDRFRKWYENNGDNSFLDKIESEKMEDYLKKRSSILIYE